ncbi:MAG: adenylate kinase [Anaerolineaceae bacterium]|nr:adenylate kinase [Anaerolineaceae bacterium]
MAGRFIVLLGPPGAGKGTQAAVISKTLQLAHISSGDIFRENLKNETDLGKMAQKYMNAGELVPDDVTIAMISERLSRTDCENGALLDGFPRTPAQAEALAEKLAERGEHIECVPYISVPAEELITRLSGRWTCRENGHVFHAQYNPSKKDGVCDIDGSALYQRDDDKPETVANRIRVYMDQTSPLIEYYKENQLLFEVDGTKSIEKVSELLLQKLNA